MKKSSSEYGFPIFISSTDYNLIDLRAELAKYLSDLGYKPILSSADGFHDNSPELEPWESCLQVLQSTFVMILVIDGKYGTKLEWKNFLSIIGGREVSPTHAEYIFAHATKMRMLVFIRQELLTYYQVYRTVSNTHKGEDEKIKEILLSTLPKQVEFETLKFIEEVKTLRPIPWIKSFANVTDIKEEIQKKMLNELAELFLFKSKHLESVIHAFSTLLNDLTDDKRTEILQSIGITKDLIESIENQSVIISELNKAKDKLHQEIDAQSKALEVSHKSKKENSSTLQKRIKILNDEMQVLKKKIATHENNNAKYIISGSLINYIAEDANPLPQLGNRGTFFATSPKCDKCQERFDIGILSLTKCNSCNRNLCSSCYSGFPVSGSIIHTPMTECAECRA